MDWDFEERLSGGFADQRDGTRREVVTADDPLKSRPVDDESPTDEARGRVLDIRASNQASSGVVVALWVPSPVANDLAVPDGEPAELLHVTLAYLGKTDDDALDRDVIRQVAADVAAQFPPLTGTIGGRGVFDLGDEGAVAIGLVDAVGLGELRASIVAGLLAAGQPVDETHGFQPHVSIGYAESAAQAAAIPVRTGVQIPWGSLTVAWGDTHYAMPLTGTSIRSAVAQRETRDDIGYSEPERNRIMDRYERNLKRSVVKLAEKQARVVLRRFDKIYRKAITGIETRDSNDDTDRIFDVNYWVNETGEIIKDVIETLYFDVSSKVANGLGVSFDVLSPKVLDALQRQVDESAVQITDTTRQAVFDVIEKGIEEFDSIDDMSEAMGKVFEDLQGYRSERIARTEVATAYNQASNVTAKESNVVKKKTWLVAGDPCPLCEPWAGDTVELDAKYGNGVDHPPLHPNCRCTQIYEIDFEKLDQEE